MASFVNVTIMVTSVTATFEVDGKRESVDFEIPGAPSWFRVDKQVKEYLASEYEGKGLDLSTLHVEIQLENRRFKIDKEVILREYVPVDIEVITD